jgi:vacuolar-type H+-ATPase subunit E/Vma4
MPPDPKKDFDVSTLVQEHGKDISGLGEKLAKCFSEERYNVFQEHVEKIVIKTLGSKDGRKEVKEYSTEATKEYLDENTWRKVTFWLPTIIAAVAIIVAIFKP